MGKLNFDRRCGVERREFYYTEYIPERRIGSDRRIGKNGKKVFWGKSKNTVKDYIKIWLKKSIL